MQASSDRPLDIPAQTLAVVEDARRAALHTRQSLDLALAPLLATGALAGVGLGCGMLAFDLDMPAWAVRSLVALSLIVTWGALLAMLASAAAWLKRGRMGGQNSPFGANCVTTGSRQRVYLVAISFAGVLLQFALLQSLRGRVPDAVYYGILIWGTRTTVLGGVAFFVYRFARSGFWEHLVLAAAILGTSGLYIFFPRHSGLEPLLQAGFAVLALLAALVAAASLLQRWRHWSNAIRARSAGSAVPEAV